MATLLFFLCCLIGFPFHLNEIGVTISLSFMLGLKGNTPAKHATCVGSTLFICWRNEENKQIVFPKTWRKQGKVKSIGMMSLNECFTLLTVSSFSLLEKEKQQQDNVSQ